MKINKKIIIVGCLVLIILVIATIVVVPKITYNQEKKLTNELKNLGKSFYEDNYYNGLADNDEEREKVLSKYSELGMKVSLNNLVQIKNDESDDELAKFVNKKTGENCDADNSTITIYPKEPYGVTDYNIEVTLVCGFSNNN
jgi:lipopolysaccharide export LptBFGC system permease protein LptF